MRWARRWVKRWARDWNKVDYAPGAGGGSEGSFFTDDYFVEDYFGEYFI